MCLPVMKFECFMRNKKVWFCRSKTVFKSVSWSI